LEHARSRGVAESNAAIASAPARPTARFAARPSTRRGKNRRSTFSLAIRRNSGRHVARFPCAGLEGPIPGSPPVRRLPEYLGRTRDRAGPGPAKIVTWAFYPGALPHQRHVHFNTRRGWRGPSDVLERVFRSFRLAVPSSPCGGANLLIPTCGVLARLVRANAVPMLAAAFFAVFHPLRRPPGPPLTCEAVNGGT